MSDQVQQPVSQVADDEIDLRELFTVLWQGKWIIIVTTFLFSIASVFYSLSLPNIYKSEALLAPVSAESGMKLQGQLGGLAALAGVNIGGQSNDKIELAIEVLKSRDFIGRFIEKYDLFVPLMASTGWNPSDKSLIIDPKIYNVDTKEWLRTMPAPFESKPSLQETYRQFMKLMGVTKDSKTGMVKISIEHFSPILAKSWVDKLITEINEDMRQRELAEAQRSIEYLNGQIAKTNLADARSMLFSLIEEQTKTLMLANVREEYVFQTVDPAVVAELKQKPKRSLIVAVATVLGFMFSMFVILVLSSIRKSKNN